MHGVILKEQQVISPDIRWLNMKVDDVRNPVHLNDNEGDDMTTPGR